jgi:hypothetical protein
MFHKIISIGVCFDLALVETIEQFRYDKETKLILHSRIGSAVASSSLEIPANVPYWVIKLSNKREYVTFEEHEADELFRLLSQDRRADAFDKFADNLLELFKKTMPGTTAAITPVAAPVLDPSKPHPFVGPRYAGMETMCDMCGRLDHDPIHSAQSYSRFESWPDSLTGEESESDVDRKLSMAPHDFVHADSDDTDMCCYTETIRTLPIVCFRPEHDPIHQLTNRTV